ncbi:ABC transporter ATP-binding protein [Thalassotalea sp. Y01]|uniref:ABC transporter ATP-binding protein n=1 Tax=Thalassotalea sp. Y01 TaxID=2729613 RepID=UPI00145CCF11|nr:ABC transporter ATP-binding protein [Thalassotalea sp. Y01]NMP14745.1 ABC transporter ATP-binding protein [Thalassotalea sp. Y01]
MSAVIDITNLDFSWSPQSDFRFHVDRFSISKGEKLFLKGPSGSGKTTLLSLLCGVTRANSGELKLLGQDLTKMSGAERDQFRADHIGVIFQMFNLIPYLSTIENVMLAVNFSPIRKQRALKNSDTLEDEAIRLLSHLDMGDEHLLHKPVNQLSIGQQQRVAAARALMGSPEIVVADEPTSSLDADRCHSFLQLLFKECQEAGATLIFVSHDMRLQQDFDRSLSLHRETLIDAKDIVTICDGVSA